MDLTILNDSTLWVGISFVLFVILVIKPLSAIFSEKVDSQIDLLKKEIDEAKKLKAEADELLNEHKEKEKINSKYIEELQKANKKEGKEIEERIKKEIKHAIQRKETNYELIIKQMEDNLKEKLQNEIMTKTLKFTKQRIKKIYQRNIMIFLLMSL